MKMFLSCISLTTSSCEWRKSWKLLVQIREQGNKYFCLFQITWTQDQTLGNDIWRSYFDVFFYDIAYLLFKSTHAFIIHNSLWKELHSLNTYCMKTHFCFFPFWFWLFAVLFSHAHPTTVLFSRHDLLESVY